MPTSTGSKANQEQSTHSYFSIYSAQNQLAIFPNWLRRRIRSRSESLPQQNPASHRPARRRIKFCCRIPRHLTLQKHSRLHLTRQLHQILRYLRIREIKTTSQIRRNWRRIRNRRIKPSQNEILRKIRRLRNLWRLRQWWIRRRSREKNKKN